MMTVKALEDLFEYGYWANRKLFNVIPHLTPKQFTETIAGNYGSIRNTMVHILSAEAGWLARCGGPKRGPRLKPDDFPTVASVLQTWTRVETDMWQFLAAFKDEDLGRKVEFSLEPSQEYSMPMGEVMHHVAIHGVHHRGQIALLLRSLGYPPGNFDIFNYYAERGCVFRERSPTVKVPYIW